MEVAFTSRSSNAYNWCTQCSELFFVGFVIMEMEYKHNLRDLKSKSPMTTCSVAYHRSFETNTVLNYMGKLNVVVVI